ARASRPRSGSCRHVARATPAQAERLADVLRAHGVAAVEIGDRAREPQSAVVAAAAETQALVARGEELARGRVERATRTDLGAARVGVAPTSPEPVLLALARSTVTIASMRSATAPLTRDW